MRAGVWVVKTAEMTAVRRAASKVWNWADTMVARKVAPRADLTAGLLVAQTAAWMAVSTAEKRVASWVEMWVDSMAV